MRIILTVVMLAELSAAAATAVNHSYALAGIWTLAAATSVGWALAETSADAWKRKAQGPDQ